MKRTISVWACLAILATSQLVARDSVAINIKNDLVNTEKFVAKKPVKTELAMIPNSSLHLDVDAENKILQVTLKGENCEKLDWVLFQPKVGVISRISTESKINQIKISALQPGEYVLMIKDESGRALFESFSKS